MSVQRNAQDLFEYIADVYSVNLPAIRDVTAYGDLLWWQADLLNSDQCRIKSFDGIEEGDEGGTWLRVCKTALDPFPSLPQDLVGWVSVSPSPLKEPKVTPKLAKQERFDQDPVRLTAYEEFSKTWSSWHENGSSDPPLPDDPILQWLDNPSRTDAIPLPLETREIIERFEDDPRRQQLFSTYIEGQWSLWAGRTRAPFKANLLYDELFSLHQRLSVEGERWEILWGHLLLSWEHSPGHKIYHPLLLTPLFLDFNAQKRTIQLTQTQTTRLEFECLRDLDYSYKDTLLDLLRKVNEGEEPLNPWSNDSVRALASTISGYLSSKAQAETNLYSDEPVPRKFSADLELSNSPVIFVRERVRQFWIQDAKKVAAEIALKQFVPPFIHAAVSDPEIHEQPRYTWDEGDRPSTIRSASGQESEDDKEDSDGELYFPLHHNEQQKEIWQRLRDQFGVLVQGPPGTGKSHTIANIICDQLARGHKVLITSQTENALRVLRGHIPEGIRSLCVSQLGNDAESKRELHEAVTTIGKHFSERNSGTVGQRISKILSSLREVREHQASVQNQVREWAKLDSETLLIGTETITAHEAAKQVAILNENNNWLPDSISPDDEPPLIDAELIEVCSLIKELSQEDRDSCEKRLPSLEAIPTFQQVTSFISELRAAQSLDSETESEREQWSSPLFLATFDQLEQAIRRLELAITELSDVRHEWQVRVLELIISHPDQLRFWSSFIKTCSNLRQKAFSYFERIQGYRIEGLENLDEAIEWPQVLEELFIVVDKGKNPANFFTSLMLSREAKRLFQQICVDNKPLNTVDRINIVSHHIEYIEHIRRFETRWQQTIKVVKGPECNEQASMRLADIDERIRTTQVPIGWFNAHYEDVKNVLSSLGCPRDQIAFHDKATLTKHLKSLVGQRAAMAAKELTNKLLNAKNTIARLSRFSNCHQLMEGLCRAIDRRSPPMYEENIRELERLHLVSTKVYRLDELLNKLRTKTPHWSVQLERIAREQGPAAIPPDWKDAWKCRRLNAWLDKLHARESNDQLQRKSEKLRTKERELLTELIIERTWQRQMRKVKDQHYTALGAWAGAMKSYGKGTGTHAHRYLAAATKAMVNAVKAVPVWIMPLYRVVQSFPAEAGLFDLVIVDEASQCDIRALPVLFRAKRVLVVGDPEQISPTNVGVPREQIFELIRLRLSQIPQPIRFSIDNSLFSITETIPRMTRTMLTEHFRCVPEIIEFNNSLCPSYGGKLEPLRQANPHERLTPPLVSVCVPTGFKNFADVNEPEADALVEAVRLCCRCDKYAGKTMGIISLRGENQAKYISERLAKTLDEVELSKRRIICGDSYAFQGDERDVMFLSLVVARNAAFTALVTDDARQRFNVATSRAKDQVFLFHSIQPEDIGNENCVRYKLLKWYQNPPLAEMKANIETLRERADSPFEIEVGTTIIKRGYKVIPQYRPFLRDAQYRIDLLVQGDKGRIAVECDGDRWHGPERWEYDQRREAQLRRAGLRFWRVNGSAFYRNRELSLNSLWPILNKYCNGRETDI